MDDAFSVHLDGAEELRKRLADLSDKLRKKVVLSALRKAAGIIRVEAKKNTPVLKRPKKYRKPGTVRDNITVRASKFAKGSGDLGVYVGVRPLRGKARVAKFGKASAQNPNDPYYWWWVEFGYKVVPPKSKANPGSITKRRKAAKHSVPGKRFLTKAGDTKGQAAIDTFMAQVVPAIEKFNGRSS